MKVVINFLLFFLVFAVTAGASPFFLFKENGKVGLKNQSGKVLIPAQYDEIGWSDGKFSVTQNVTGYRSGESWGLINTDNHRITRPEYSSIIPSESGLVIARRKTPTSVQPMVGCITLSGKPAIPFIYDGIEVNFMRAIVFTKIGNQFRYGLIDLENKTLIPQQYQEINALGTLRYAVRNFEGKIALFSELGKQLTGFTIDSLSSFAQNFSVIHEGKFMGIIDRDGQIKLPVKFREVNVSSEGKITYREADEWSFISGDNKLVRQLKADSIVAIAENVFKVKTGKQVEIVDAELQPVFRDIFTDISSFEKGKAIYYLGSLMGVIQPDGKVIVPAIYHNIIIGEKFILANNKTGGKSGWILFDANGTRKNLKNYETITPFFQDHFAVQNKGYWGILNATGQEVVACVYDSLIQRLDNLMVVKFRGLFGIINTQEEWIISPKPSRIKLLSKDRYFEFGPTAKNLKRMDGNSIYFTSNQISLKSDYFLEFLTDGNIWKVDFNGVIVDRQFPLELTERLDDEREGYRIVKRNGRYGFVDSKGRLRIANRYENVQPFSEGFAAVKILGKWGFINQQDNLTVQPVYEWVGAFHRGYAVVKQKGLFGVINTQGKVVLPIRYEKVDLLQSGNWKLQSNGQAGLGDPSGNVFVNPRYDGVVDTNEGFVIVHKDGKYGVINYSGISTIPLIYDYICFDQETRLFISLARSKWMELR